MDFKRIKTNQEAITRNFSDFDKETENIYKTIVVLSKRANQITTSLKEEIHEKLKEFGSSMDNLEEIFENREQIEMAKIYESIPKSTLLAIHELLNDKLYFEEPETDTI
jgi:ferritin-like metal-binding protein YciE